MELFDVVANSIDNTKASLWPGFAPELIICATIFLLLIFRLVSLHKIVPPFLVTLIGSLLALYYCAAAEVLAGS